MKKSIADEILGRIMHEMKPVCEIIDRLHSQGYDLTFYVDKNQMLHTKHNVCYKREDFTGTKCFQLNNDWCVLKGYRLVALQGPWNNFKGILFLDPKANSGCSK